MDFLFNTLSASWVQAIESFGQLGPEHVMVILVIAMLEGLLSVDNALVIASLAKVLPAKQERMAIVFGIAAGALLRVVALFFAAIIMQYDWIKLLGAAYLLWLSWAHWLKPLIMVEKHTPDEEGANVKARAFMGVVGSIALADLAFSIDNVVAAVGMSDVFAVVILGVGAGIFTMIFATQLVSVLMKRFPSLEPAAYVVVGVIGLFIVLEVGLVYLGVHVHIPELVKVAVVFGVVIVAMLKDWRGEKHERSA